MNQPAIDWYFDFISPYAYLQWQRLRREAPQLALNPKPVLFAGLLSHWDHKGPAEITPKRSWTYAHCLWIAQRHDIPMQLPSAHPFNPLPLLRLALALDSTEEVVDRLFAYVWRQGLLPQMRALGKICWTSCWSSPPTSAPTPSNRHCTITANRRSKLVCSVCRLPWSMINFSGAWTPLTCCWLTWPVMLSFVLRAIPKRINCRLLFTAESNDHSVSVAANPNRQGA